MKKRLCGNNVFYISIFLTFSALMAFSGFSVAQDASNPWDDQNVNRSNAVVRIEIGKADGSNPSYQVGTGFIVLGKLNRYFVITATHVISSALGPIDPAANIACTPLSKRIKLYEKNRSGTELIGTCAYSIGNDVSLIRLEAPAVKPYSTLELVSKDLKLKDKVFLAGYPNQGQLNTMYSGVVTDLSGENNTVVNSTPTISGFSGGPYLDEDGYVVGIHHGANNVQFAHLIPIILVESELKSYISIRNYVRTAGVQKIAEPFDGGSALCTSLGGTEIKQTKTFKAEEGKHYENVNVTTISGSAPFGQGSGPTTYMCSVQDQKNKKIRKYVGGSERDVDVISEFTVYAHADCTSGEINIGQRIAVKCGVNADMVLDK